MIEFDAMDIWTQEELEEYRKMLDNVSIDLDIDIEDIVEKINNENA